MALKRFAPFPARKSGPKKLSARQKLEREVMGATKKLLIKYGWRPVRMSHVRGICGEPGICDHLFLRYMDPNGAALAMWIEFKREKRGRLGEDQRKWHAKERKAGALVRQVSSAAEFDAWYWTKFGWLHTNPEVAGQAALDLGNSNVQTKEGAECKKSKAKTISRANPGCGIGATAR